jgi:hypothetical protein
MGLREHIAQEMQEELEAIHAANSEVNRRCTEPLALDPSLLLPPALYQLCMLMI